MHKINTGSVYWRRYIKFIQSRSNRIVPTNSIIEIHHIIPKCAGGDNSATNLIELTVREHFIAHWMLSKVGLNDVWYKLRFAFGCMSVSSQSNSYRKLLTSTQFEQSKKVRKETLVQWNSLVSSKVKGTSWYVDEDGTRYRCHQTSPRVKEFNLTLESPAKGKKWFTDGIKFFMLYESDPIISSLGLTPGSPGKNRSKQYSPESLKSLSENRAGRLWFNNGIRSFKLKPTDSKINDLKLVPGRLLSADSLSRIKNGASWARSLEDNIKNSSRQKGKLRFNDGVRNFTLLPNDPLINKLSLHPGVILSPEGKSQLSFCSGHKDVSYITGKKWFNDGIKNYRLPESEGRTLNLTPGKIRVVKPANP